MRILPTVLDLYFFRKYITGFLLAVCISCCFSCKQTPYIDEHPAFISAILTRTDTAQNKYIDKAFYFIDSAFKSLSAPGIGDIFIKDSIIQSKYFYVKHDYIRSIAYLDGMLALVQAKTAEEKYAERYATVLYLKGEAFRSLKRYNEALRYISQGEDAVLKLVKEKCNMADYLGRKANLMFEQEKYTSSAAYYLQQSQHLQAVCDTGSHKLLSILSSTLNNAGLSYLRAGLLDSAAWYEDAALRIINKTETLYMPTDATAYAKAVVYGDQAEVLVLKGKSRQAADLYKKSIAGTSKADTGYTQSTHIRLAELYLKENNHDSARQVLEQLQHSLTNFSNEKALIKWYKLTVQYYAQAKQVAEAFKYQQLYEAIRDSVDTRDKKFVTADLGKEFENLELRYSNEVLQKEGKLKNLYLVISIFTFIAVAAITLFVWYNLRRTRKLHLQVKQKNEDMQKAYASLEQSHQENSRIIRIVAHDLKNPISAINYLIFSLLRKDYPGDLKEVFQLIKTACGNSMVLINDALSEKKNRTVIRKELVDMKKLLEHCVDLLQAKADEKKQQLLLEAENVMLMLNQQKMWRVVSNIVNNAIKFSPELSVIDIKLQRKEHTVILSVQDNGIGIPADMKDKIFAMSPEAGRHGTAGEESHGLGLSISRQIIEEHEGKIWFESYDGKGSVFYVELPYAN